MIAKEIRHITDMASSPYVRNKIKRFHRDETFFHRISQIWWILQYHIRKYSRDSVINQQRIPLEQYGDIKPEHVYLSWRMQNEFMMK
jgi:hypothetical protein